MQENTYTGVLVWDIQRAFDRVWHQGLIYKLTLQNYSTSIFKVINSFLSNQIKIQKCLSTPRPIEAEVPQGFPLRPLLYNLYTANISNRRQFNLLIHADDAAITSQHWDLQTVQTNLRTHFNDNQTWCKQWKIRITTEKTQLICISRWKILPT